MAIIDADAYKTYAGVTGTADDVRIAVLIGYVESELSVRCNGRTFEDSGEEGSEVEVYDGLGAEVIQLKSPPITSVTSVETRAGTTWTTLATTSYSVPDLTDGRLFAIGSAFGWSSFEPGCWPEGRSNVRVTYRGGYTSAAMPGALKNLVCELVDEARIMAGKAQGELSAEGVGTVTETRRTVAEVIDRYMHRIRPWQVWSI